jgi:hypothetical protein
VRSEEAFDSKLCAGISMNWYHDLFYIQNESENALHRIAGACTPAVTPPDDG